MAKLLNISEAASIAIHGLAMISHSKEYLNVNKMADDLGFSRNHMSKILQILVRYGYIMSERGPKGGFKMKVDPAQISLLEIYELIEGQLDEGHCNHDREKCPFEVCVYGGINYELTAKFKDFFRNKKLSDITIKTVNV
jgi:Rrf2 family protein